MKCMLSSMLLKWFTCSIHMHLASSTEIGLKIKHYLFDDSIPYWTQVTIYTYLFNSYMYARISISTWWTCMYKWVSVQLLCAFLCQVTNQSLKGIFFYKNSNSRFLFFIFLWRPRWWSLSFFSIWLLIFYF